MNGPRFELLRRYGSRGHAQMDNLRLDVEGLRIAVENRLQAQERLFESALAQRHLHAAEAMQPHLRLATQEAIAFAEQGLRDQETANQACLEALQLEVTRLCAVVEARSPMQEPLFCAVRKDGPPCSAQALEPRIRLATYEAIAFARQELDDRETANQARLEALQLEVERLLHVVETRLQTPDRLFHALPEENPGPVAEALERRIQLAAQEAIAFAEQRLERQEATLRALGRRFAEFAREAAPEAAPERAALEAVAYMLGPAGEDAEGARRLPLSEESEEAFVRDAANLPIPLGGASRLVASRVIEHIALAALEARVLPHWRSRMAAGGELVVTTRDGPAFFADLAARGDFSCWRASLFGPGAHALRNLLDGDALVALLARAGFAPETPTRGDGLALRVVARA